MRRQWRSGEGMRQQISFAPAGACRLDYSFPTACAVGYLLTLLRSFPKDEIEEEGEFGLFGDF